MKRFLLLKNGLININLWKKEIMTKSEESTKISEKISNNVEKSKNLKKNRPVCLDKEKDDDLNSQISLISNEYLSLNKQLELYSFDGIREEDYHKELQEMGNFGILNERTTILGYGIFLWAALGVIWFMLYLLSIAFNGETIRGFTESIILVSFVFFTPLLYRHLRRNLPGLKVNTGPSLFEIPILFCWWFLLLMLLGIGASDTLWRGTDFWISLGVSIFCLCVCIISTLVIMASQKKKFLSQYNMKKHLWFKNIEDSLRSQWQENGSDENHKEIIEKISSNRKQYQELLKQKERHDSISKVYKEHMNAEEILSNEISEQSLNLSEIIEDIINLEIKIDSTWNEIKSMIPT
tara:strand:+ start:698 stop:1750 length:1053 start_codon:yes stop_codon:yes gene_type:complete